jgi:hypothetical protein
MSCHLFFLNLQDLLTGKYHEQKILDEEKRLKRRTKSAQKRELKRKRIYEVETKYVSLSCVFLSCIQTMILIDLADVFMVLLDC